MGGLLLVDKPSGCTSHDVVGRVRAVIGTKKVGHAGTLDPMATGLLVLAVGKSTRLLGQLALTGKSYRATIRLGVSTVSDDAEGEVITEVDAGGVSDEEIRGEIAALTGAIDQVPSSVSAIKVAGRRAHELMRAGEQVELAARPVTVSRFELVAPVRRHGPFLDLDVEVDCSSGTYIRALARDLGAALGVGGHLTALRRTRVGPFDLAAACDVFGGPPPARGEPKLPITEALREDVRLHVIPAGVAATLTFADRRVETHHARALGYGQPIPGSGHPEVVVVLDQDAELVALVQDRDDGQAWPVVVFRSGESE